MQVFEALTNTPRRTWIPSGVIGARHEKYRAPETTDADQITEAIEQELQAYLANPKKPELTEKLQQMKAEAMPFSVRYRLSNEYTMVSTVTLKYGGNRFYWEINVDSRTDSVQPPAELADNFYTDEFDLDWNQLRVFAWDGEKYTTYFRPGNQAIITAKPSGVNGPLTAGIIPWGYGYYSLVSLSAAESSALETEAGGQTEVHLTVVNGDKTETFVLDPQKDYAVTLCSAVDADGSLTVRTYDGYQAVNGRYCPGTVTIEQFDTTGQPPKLLARDVWDFDLISNGPVDAAGFEVDLEYDAFIEDYRFGDKPLQYRYAAPEPPQASNIDVNKLLHKRLEIAFEAESQALNCATAALGYVCGELGRNPSPEQLARLVHGERRSTNMLEMQQFVRGLGLSAVAVKAGLDTLGGLGSGRAILHLPDREHFVVLGNVDDKYVRLIDLDKHNFFFRTGIDRFEAVWDQTALLVDSGPFEVDEALARIDDSLLGDLTGAAACEKCNNKVQDANDPGCDAVCDIHTIKYERWQCGSASSGTCSESDKIKKKWEVCDIDPVTFDCEGLGSWTSVDMQACQ
jgi:hypothetical protein